MILLVLTRDVQKLASARLYWFVSSWLEPTGYETAEFAQVY